jgi:hypothetical protein
MTKERAVLWMGVMILMTLGFILGQNAAIMVAAVVAAYLLYEQIKQGQGTRGTTTTTTTG